MFINRYAKIVVSIALAFASRQLFAMDDEMAPSTKPGAAAAAEPPTIAAPGSIEWQLIKACEITDLAKALEEAKRIFAENPKEAINLDAQDENKDTALTMATAKQNLALVQLLVERGAGIDIPCSKSAITALEIATILNDLKIVQFLITHQANVNKHDKTGRTILMMAVDYSDLDIISCLIQAGARVNDHDDRLQTALLIATASRSQADDYILNSRDNNMALSHRDLDIVDCLVKAGADIYARNIRGTTALSSTHSYDVAEYLATAMSKRQAIYALHLCNECAPSDDPNFIDFPPELIDRVLKPTIIAALLCKNKYSDWKVIPC